MSTDFKVLGTRSVIIETRDTLELEHEGKKYTVHMFCSDHNSYIEWYDKDWKPISCPDWADDLDTWEIYNENEGQ